MYETDLDQTEEMTLNGPKDGSDISASQKMLSAVSGSVLTSLLGKIPRKMAFQALFFNVGLT